jgi:superfamily II DNA/RNA helicase
MAAFGALGLDARVVRAAAKRFALPSAVQAKTIPLVLAGKVRSPCASSSARGRGSAAAARCCGAAAALAKANT